MPKTLKTKISEILVKHHLHTNQSAINALVRLFEAEKVENFKIKQE